ncbi:hypothetical protein [Flavobacterium sp. HJSW_4]
MKDSKLTFNDFQLDTISKKDQKAIKGGSQEPDVDPGKSGGGGNM